MLCHKSILINVIWWGEKESNLHSQRRRVYSPLGSPRAQSRHRNLVGDAGFELAKPLVPKTSALPD